LVADNRSVAIVTDSTADVPPQEVQRLNINVVPAVLTIDGQTYTDGVELSREEFYARMPEMKRPATTAVPSPITFEQMYQTLFEQGFERILSIHISSHLSGMLNAASRAAQAFENRVHCFDSLQVSMGLGFQVMEAAAAALTGATMESLKKVVRQARDKVHLAALIDTLEYLKRSGRVSWIRAGLGDLLKLKLLVGVQDGVVERIDNVRTKRKGLEAMLETARSWQPLQRLAILHSGIPDQAADFVERVRDLAAESPLIVDVTTVIGAHVGPGSIGLAGLSD
jgi:DegV family protein with EDD domain